MRIPQGGIAFFDSGIGGLTVLAACEKYFPGELFYYYGDNRHAPYGNLPLKKIHRYVERIFKLFRRLRVRAAVIACNTATAVCIDSLRKKYSFPIIGIEPAVLLAAAHGGEIITLVTRATFESERFRFLCERAKERFPNCKIHPIACDGLAGAIEQNIGRKEFDYTPFLPPLKGDVIVLGCTHYGYIKDAIEARYHCQIYDGNEGVARRLFSVLQAQKEKSRDGRPQRENFVDFLGFLTTKTPSKTRKDRKGINANKCSPQNLKKPLKNQGKTRICFLGKDREKNRKIYKQTYVRDDL